MFVTIISFLVVLLVLILAHEFGHFITAKLSGVKVEEFGIFMPPRLLSFKHGETIYSLNALPLGGFTKMAGEVDPDELAGKGIKPRTDKPENQGAEKESAVKLNRSRTLAGKSIPIRILVLGAGSIMNFVLPLFLLAIAFMIPHLEFVNDQTPGQVVVEDVAANSPASQAGIKVGDYIVSIGGQKLTNASEYATVINQYLDKPVTIGLKHENGTTADVTLTPRSNPPAGEGKTGIAIGTVVKKSSPFWQAIPDGAVRYWQFLVAFKDGIVATVKGTVPFEVTGPVGIAQETGRVVRSGGIAALLQFAAFISLNLGIVNIFPIPALDGGRIAFVLLEWVRHGKRVSPKTEALVHAIGFLALMALLVLVTYHDIFK